MRGSIFVFFLALFVACTGADIIHYDPPIDGDRDEADDSEEDVPDGHFPDGDGGLPDGDDPDGDDTDSDDPNGDDPDGDDPDGDDPDGDDPDGDDPDGDDPDGDDPDGDETDGDDSDGDETCTDRKFYTCHAGDVYWYDSCGYPQEIKESCNDCNCVGNACVVEENHSTRCHEGIVYWYDCHGVRGAQKEDCGSVGCCDGVCMSAVFPCCDGVCTDPATGLEWQQAPTGGEKNWQNALAHCQALSLKGSGWRLPNISELRSLIRNCPPIQTGGTCGILDVCGACGVASDEACLEMACFSSVDCAPSSCPANGGPTGCYWPNELAGVCFRYWSSSFGDSSSNAAWYVGFVEGWVNSEYKDHAEYGHHRVRCVRDGV